MEDNKENQLFQSLYHKWLKKNKKEHTKNNFSEFCFAWNVRLETSLQKARTEHLNEMIELCREIER